MIRYYVWNKKGRMPEFEHHSLYAATIEAERLAKLNTGHSFSVLHEVHIAKALNNKFSDVAVGEKFKHGNRTLIKVTAMTYIDSHGEERSYNAVRLAPEDVAGKMSNMSNNTTVERIK